MDQPLRSDWYDFELYEKTRVRERRKRLMIIAFAGLVFLGLCAVPVVNERLPKWRSLDAALDLSKALDHLKTRSIQEKKPLWLHFVSPGMYRVDRVADCGSKENPVLEKEAPWSDDSGALKVMSAAELATHSIALGVEGVCFDPVYGLSGVSSRLVLVVVPVKDLAEGRLDRASYVELDGESAKISIN